MTGENFGAVTKEELALLKTGSAILPELIGHNGELIYDHMHKVSDINKAEYKRYQNGVAQNIASLQATMETERCHNCTVLKCEAMQDRKLEEVVVGFSACWQSIWSQVTCNSKLGSEVQGENN